MKPILRNECSKSRVKTVFSNVLDLVISSFAVCLLGSTVEGYGSRPYSKYMND
jgi:hypothetical protein